MTSASWTDDKLSRIGTPEELKVASVRKDGTLRPFVTVWVVRVRENSYVRSAYGQDNPWFVRATASGRGRIRAGGNEKDVVFAETATSAHPDIDAAYQGKYGRFGAGSSARWPARKPRGRPSGWSRWRARRRPERPKRIHPAAISNRAITQRDLRCVVGRT